MTSFRHRIVLEPSLPFIRIDDITIHHWRAKDHNAIYVSMGTKRETPYRVDANEGLTFDERLGQTGLFSGDLADDEDGVGFQADAGVDGHVFAAAVGRPDLQADVVGQKLTSTTRTNQVKKTRPSPAHFQVDLWSKSEHHDVVTAEKLGKTRLMCFFGSIKWHLEVKFAYHVEMRSKGNDVPSYSKHREGLNSPTKR